MKCLHRRKLPIQCYIRERGAIHRAPLLLLRFLDNLKALFVSGLAERGHASVAKEWNER
jgi:hypothetical protein